MRASTVSFYNFKSQSFKLSFSNPKSKYVAYLSVLSQISDFQSLGRKNKHEILKTERNVWIVALPSSAMSPNQRLNITLLVLPCRLLLYTAISKLLLLVVSLVLLLLLLLSAWWLPSVVSITHSLHWAWRLLSVIRHLSCRLKGLSWAVFTK